jgi:DNA-binding SARP family transcriptional activator
VNEISSLLEIRLFGIPGLLLNGHSVESLRRKNRALIYYLAAQEGQSTREKLLTFFWPDRERSAAQAILRTMIHDLRKKLGEAFRADDQIIALSPDAFIDAGDFLTALNSPSSVLGKLTEALDHEWVC